MIDERRARPMHEPGIHFGLPEERYRADPALSTSAIKDILISPLTCWTNHVDPDREDGAGTMAQENGRALHARLVEGAGAFAGRYAVKPDIADYPDAIDGVADLRDRCAELGLGKGGTKLEMAKRIAEADRGDVLWPLIMRTFLEINDGLTILSADFGREIEARARLVETHPALRKAFDGGFPEVSMFWEDPETGVRMKARLDYLKTRAVVDLKTFGNPLDMPIDTAIARAVANRRYHVQAVVYLEAVETAKAMISAGNAACLHGEPPDDAWLEAFATTPEHAFVFVFLQQTGAPNLRPREFPRRNGDGAETLSWQAGRAAFRQGVRLYAEWMDRMGPDRPWVEDRPVTPFADDEFPLWMMD